MKKGMLKELYKQGSVIRKECENCGERYKENIKQCPRCKIANLDFYQYGRENNWLHNTWKPEDY